MWDDANSAKLKRYLKGITNGRYICYYGGTDKLTEIEVHAISWKYAEYAGDDA